MANKKNVIDLSEVTEEQFEGVTKAISKWKEAGYSGNFSFVTTDEVENTKDVLSKAFVECYNDGCNDTLKGVAIGAVMLAAGVAIVKGIKHFKNKKTKEEVEE